MDDMNYNDSRANAHTDTASTTIEMINDEQFEDMRDLLEEDFVDLVQTYLVDSHKRIATLRAAQLADDNPNGFEAAHGLKGASANLGATQLTILSGQLQEACRAQKISDSAALINDLSAALLHTEQQINQRLGL